MRIIAAIAIAMASLWFWDQSGIPVNPIGVAAIVILIPGLGLWLETRKNRNYADPERAPGRLPEWAELTIAGLVSTAPIGVALLIGEDPTALWPILIGMGGVLVLSIGYAVWLNRRRERAPE